MSWLLGADAAALPAAAAAAALPLLPRLRLPRGGGSAAALSWQALLAAAALSANVAALAVVARRAYASWRADDGSAASEAGGSQSADEQGGEDGSGAATEAEDGSPRQRQRARRPPRPGSSCDSAGEEQSEVTRAALAYLQRLWDIAMQQAGAAGAPADLGLPDAEGVYTYTGRDGCKLYFRRAPRGEGGNGKADGGACSARGGGVHASQWQWSTSRRLWLPTSAADSIWCDSGDSEENPGLGGRLLIRRLELEAQLVCGARCRVACAAGEPLRALPPLELPPLCGGGGGGSSAKGSPSAGAAAAAAASRRAVSCNGKGCGGAAGGGGADVSSHHFGDIPDSFLCPLSQRVMTDPVVTPGGLTYERAALRDWIERKGTDPATGHPLAPSQLYANLNLRDQICEHFLVRKHRHAGTAAGTGSAAAAGRAGGSCRGGGGGGDAGSTPDVSQLQDTNSGRARCGSWQTH